MLNTTLCYLENDRGEYLMLHRIKKKHDINQDKWIGVGGKFEGEESPDECLLREVQEETGLTLTDYHFRGVVTFLFDGGEGEYMYLFTATGWTGELTRDCVEGNLEWVPKERVRDLPIWEGDFLSPAGGECPGVSAYPAVSGRPTGPGRVEWPSGPAFITKCYKRR